MEHASDARVIGRGTAGSVSASATRAARFAPALPLSYK
ncbi:MAG: hypothetical protein JWQ87_2436 [Candidatus Sulfotelmatobacter sp.]|nr:hypothetical protein [Candidatus Sulfotelmatobacter sp.]